MEQMIKKIVVKKILYQNDRTCLYGDDVNYFVVMSKDEPLIVPGDIVKYEPCGINFGWFLSKVT